MLSVHFLCSTRVLFVVNVSTLKDDLANVPNLYQSYRDGIISSLFCVKLSILDLLYLQTCHTYHVEHTFVQVGAGDISFEMELSIVGFMSLLYYEGQ